MLAMNQQRELQYLVENGQRWVAEQRALYRPFGRALTAEESGPLSPYFDTSTLDSVVIREVPLLENPGFYSELTARGIPFPLDFSKMDAITFVDTVVVARLQVNSNNTSWLPLLFHESVHVCQYKVLGLDAFIKHYVDGWATNERNYYAIPLEVQAYELQDCYENATQPFSVEQIVLHRYTGQA